MNLQPINQEFREAVDSGCQMVSVMLFRVKNKKTKKWEWRYDTKTIEDNGLRGKYETYQLLEAPPVELKNEFINGDHEYQLEGEILKGRSTGGHLI